LLYQKFLVQSAEEALCLMAGFARVFDDALLRAFI